MPSLRMLSRLLRAQPESGARASTTPTASRPADQLADPSAAGQLGGRPRASSTRTTAARFGSAFADAEHQHALSMGIHARNPMPCLATGRSEIRQAVAARGYCRGRASYTRTVFTRISIDPRIMGGTPCIAGTRIPAAMLVRMVADGMTVAQILEDYPQLAAEDVEQGLRYAASSVDHRTIVLDQPA